MGLYFWLYVALVQATNVISYHHGKNPKTDSLRQTGIKFANVIKNITRVNDELQKLINEYESLQKQRAEQDLSKKSDEFDENMDGSEEIGVNNSNLGATQIIWEDIEEDKSDINIEDTSIAKQVKMVSDNSHTTKKVSKELFIPPIESTHDSDKPRNTKERTKKKVKEHEENTDISKNLKRKHKSQNDDTELRGRSDLESKPVVQNRLFSETFSVKNIWNDIVNNVPIILEAHAMRKMMTSPKRREGKTAIIIITNNNQTGDTSETVVVSSTEVNNHMEVVKATSLRAGDDCVRLVIRKCYKAMKAVSKSMCSIYKCKNSYKEKFLEFSKTGCIKQFVGNKTEVDDDIFYRGQNDKLLKINENEKFVDLTREGYMKTCLPHVESQIRELEEKEPTRMSPNKTALTNPLISQFNILRDRFEKACKKISTDKCVQAGKYASEQICESYPCSSRKKRSYSKVCKRECKNAYQTRYSGKWSRSDSSSDSSSSDSDSDSDSSD